MLTKWRNFFTPARVVFIFALVYLSLLLGQGIIQKRNLDAEKKEVENRVAKQQVLKAYYQRTLRLLGQDWYIEKLARTRLMMVAKGESAFKIFSAGIKEEKD